MLLRGSIRYNLDPLGEAADDAVLLAALERAGLARKLSALAGNGARAGGLDAQVAEGGSNLSAGERQLLCMARALVRGASVLLMDEATASVDADADRLVQDMVRECFRDKTVLTIAHRLHTVAFYEKVLVLEGGAVAEYDAPLALLERAGGALRKLAERSGDLEGLARVARESER